MACGEDEPQHVIADVVIERGLRAGLRVPAGFNLIRELTMLSLEELVAPEVIDRTVFGRACQPGGGIVGDARLGPLLERGQKGVLCKVLGQADVANDACDRAGDAGGFDAPDGVDDAMKIGGGHRPGSEHSRPTTAAAWPSEWSYRA